MIKLWSISRNTFLQTIRQPIYTVMVLVTFALLVFTLPFTGYTMSVDYHESDQQMLEDLGLATLRISGLLIAAFSASGVLRREIEEKTALIVIAKPVSRAVFVAGKFLGVTGAVAVAYYLCSLVFLMTVRHRVMPAAFDKADWPVIVIGLSAFGVVLLVTMLGNLWFGWQFTSTGVWTATIVFSAAMGTIAFVGRGWHVVPFGQGIGGQLLLEIAMMFMAVVIFSALAVTASTRLGQAMTLLVCAGVFFLGSAHPQVVGRWADEVPVARVVGWLLPNFTYFYPQDDLTIERTIPLHLVGSAALYCVLYSAGVLAVGIGLFQTRELEAAGTSAATPPLVNVVAWAGRAAGAACGLAAIVLLSLPRFYSTATFALAAALLVAAPAGWVVWGAFARGRKWGYWLVLAAHVPVLAGAAAAVAWPALLPQGPVATPVVSLAAAGTAAAVLLVLFLPKTRRHFLFGAR